MPGLPLPALVPTEVKALQLTLGLDEIAAEIHRVWADTRSHQIAAWEGYFAVGHLLTDARSRFRWDREYGQWRESQRFGFGAAWARNLRRIAEDEAAAREFLAASALAGKTPGVEAVIGHLQERDREAERDADRLTAHPSRRYRLVISTLRAHCWVLAIGTHGHQHHGRRDSDCDQASRH